MITLRTSLVSWLTAALAVSIAHASAPLAPAWVFPREGHVAPIASSPTIYHDVVFIGSDDGNLYALHATGAAGGTLLSGFPVTLDGAIKGRPAVYGDLGAERVYVATTAGSLYAFNLDGSPAWGHEPQRICPGVPIVSTPAVRGDKVYVTASNGRIIRRNTSDGSDAGGLTYGRVVQTTLARSQRMPPAQSFLDVANAKGLFPSGRIVVESALRLGRTQRLEFTYSNKNTAVKPNRLLNVTPVGSGSTLTSLAGGSTVMGYGPGASATASPAVPGRADSTLVIAALDNDMSATRPGFGRNIVALKSEAHGLVPQWEATYGARLTTAPVVDDRTGNLFVGTWVNASSPSSGGRLYCLHASNGQPAWPGEGYIALPSGALKSGPWFERSRHALYFGTTDGTLYGINAADGTPAFPATRLDGVSGPFVATPVVVGGTAYIGSEAGRFYSVPVDDPSGFRVYSAPGTGAFEGSPSASGSEPGTDVVAVGSTAGSVWAFPVQ